MLGYDLPEVVRDRLRKIVEETKLYIREKHIRCEVTKVDEDRVRLLVEERYTVENPTTRTEIYDHQAVFEPRENADNVRLGITSDPGTAGTVPLNAAPEVDLLRAGPREVTVRGKSSVQLFCSYTCVRPIDAWQEFFQALPVLKIVMYLPHAGDLYVRAGGNPTHVVDNEFTYEALFMPSEKITVRWRPVDRPWTTAYLLNPPSSPE